MSISTFDVNASRALAGPKSSLAALPGIDSLAATAGSTA
jgi:hypothetical protein